MTADFAGKIVRNAIFVFLGRLWFLAFSIVLTPYLLARLGNDAYGIWVLIGAILAYLGLLDLGFGTSFVKHVAEYDARGDRDAVSGVLSAGIAFYLGIAIVIVLIAQLSGDFILEFLSVPRGMEETARRVLLLGVVASLFASFIELNQSIINGLQRMDVSGGVAFCLSLCYGLGCVVVLEAGLGIIGLAIAQLATQVVGVIVSASAARWLYPTLRFELRLVTRYQKLLFRYGLNVYVSNIARVANTHLDKVLISRFIGPGHVTLYDIGVRPLIMARSFPLLMLSSLTPAAADLEVRSGAASLYRVFWTASKYVSAIAFPMVIGLMLASQSIIEVWVGAGYDASAVVMRILAVGFLCTMIAGPVAPLVLGIGRPEYQRNAEAAAVLLNLVLSISLIYAFGFYGAAVGTAASMSLASVYYVWVFHRLMSRPLWPFIRATYLSPAACTIAAATVAYVVQIVLEPHRTPGRPGTLMFGAVVGFVFGATYLIAILRCRYLDADEIGLLRRHALLGWRGLLDPVRRVADPPD